jgi:hypothetical protein
MTGNSRYGLKYTNPECKQRRNTVRVSHNRVFSENYAFIEGHFHLHVHKGIQKLSAQ